MDSLDLNMLTSAESLVSYHRISKLTMTGNLLSQLDTHSLPNALRHLNLRNNLLTEINTAGLPVDLQHLGLAGNQVQQLTNENLGHFAREGLTVCAIHWILSLPSSDFSAHELKSTEFDLEDCNDPQFQVSLEGNPFLCSCSSSNLHTFLHEHYPSVDKFMNVTVACDVQEETIERILYDLKEVEFCEPLPLLLLFLASGSFLVLVSFILILHFFYKDTIVIWVFSKSWGKVFFSEEIVDREKPFDAFLSYSHQVKKILHLTSQQYLYQRKGNQWFLNMMFSGL